MRKFIEVSRRAGQYMILNADQTVQVMWDYDFTYKQLRRSLVLTSGYWEL